MEKNPKSLYKGLNLDSINAQIQNGQWSWAVNALVDSFDGNSIIVQNEQANTKCTSLPEGWKVIGIRPVFEKNAIILWLCKNDNSDSQIGLVDINTCEYTKKIQDPCIGFRVDKPILQHAVKLTNCSFEVYWTDSYNERRFMDFENLPFKEEDNPNGCGTITTTEVDCNKLRVQPNFLIPQLEVQEVQNDGELLSGTYQFAIQYCNAVSEGYTSYYSITNPLSIFDPNKITQDFNLPVNKSIVVNISNLDRSGYYDYFNLAVIRTVNNISTPTLVGTYLINDSAQTIHYTGQNKTEITLTAADIFEKYPIYEKADGVTTVQDILVWKSLVTNERINYQKIWSKVSLYWQTHKIKKDKPYAKQDNVVNRKGYFRDEVYPFEGVFLLKNGYQTDSFHIPGRPSVPGDLQIVFNQDVVDPVGDICNNSPQPKSYWQIYNTADVLGFEQEYIDTCTGDPAGCACYEGPYQYGNMAYWESTDTYPCREEIWGDLAGKPIRHHKFPDSTITHINDRESVYPLGIKINIQELVDAINNSDLTQDQKDAIVGFKIVRGNRANNKSIVARGLLNNVGESQRDDRTYYYPNYPYNDLNPDVFIGDSQSRDDEDDDTTRGRRLRGFANQGAKKRFTLHSPDTSFYQPNLGNILQLEAAIYGKCKAHYQQVKQHARYKFPTLNAYRTALDVAAGIGVLSASPKNFNFFNGSAAMAAFSAAISIIEKLLPRQNFAYQYNSIGDYTDHIIIQNGIGDKIRRTDLAIYAIPGMLSVGDDHPLNNFQRESSVYLRTLNTLPFPSEIPGVPKDDSRYVLSEENCDDYRNIITRDISGYYATLKRYFSNQYGQIYSYDVVDTGFQEFIDINKTLINPWRYIFGGDCFINKFAYKSKLPFFIDNRVKFPDDADVFYNELGNVGYPLYWFSTNSRGDNTSGGGALSGLKQFFGIKINNFDCSSDKFFWQDGKIYLFAYGIPYFYCESQVNVDLRQAYNDREGDFFPHVSSDIPDEWLDEVRTTIQYDNTYTYNKSYSKQNDLNFFSHLPEDFTTDKCRQELPFRCIYSEQQQDLINYRRNNWLVYRPAAKFDFPQNYGKLTSLDGIENRQLLARFENKTLLYNALLTAPTTAAEVYLGQTLFSKQVPPLDYADTDLGYVGSQHKFILKTEYGDITTDAKRGQVFLLQGQQVKELTNENVSKFFTEFFSFSIQKHFPDYPVDNHFTGCGLHGVYDPKYDRFIITKIDYQPIKTLTWDGQDFYFEETKVTLGDPEYFCNMSFTISYSFKIQGWTAFHTYIPNYYAGNVNFFYSGKQNGLWKHNITLLQFNTFYGKVDPYIIEYPYAYEYQDEIIQSVQDYSKVLQYTDFQSFIETDDYYFNKCIIYSNQQCSGILLLAKKPKNNMQARAEYPKYYSDSKEILYTKSDSFYQFNTFWDLVKDKKQPIWIKSCDSLSIFKELNQSNMSYSKLSYKKAPIRSKDLKIRLINDMYSSFKFLNMFTVTETQKSYK